MADSPPPPPPPPRPASTSITALSDDLLLEIFLRLPDVTTLARAASTCRAFLRAVRSSPAFRRRFRQLRAPPLLALLRLHIQAIVPAAAGKSSDIAAAFSSLLRDSGASESEWEIEIGYSKGCACFRSRATDQGASYNPQSQALIIYPTMDKITRFGHILFEFHTLSEDGEEKRPSRVVCVHRDRAWAWARVAVYSSQTMEWQVVLLPQMDTWGLLVDDDKYATGTVANGFVCWIHKGQGCILALNTATFQFCQMELPPPLKGECWMFWLGQTNDEKFCVVSALQCMLAVWLWAADDEGVGRFMLHKMFSLRANVSKITELSEEADVEMRPTAVINGFVYLSAYLRDPRLHPPGYRDPQSPQWFLSFCLETNEMNLLYKESELLFSIVDPYIMVSWPSTLINGKEDSDTGVTGKMSEDDGPMGTEKASPVLFTALQSFKEKIIDDDNLNFAEIESFLLDDEMNSLLNRIATLESGLAAARDRVLRIRTEPNSMSGMEIDTSESELAAARDRVLRIGTESDSDSMEGMERVSCWQMCKGMIVIAWILNLIVIAWKRWRG